MRERAQRYEANPGLVRDILMHGSQRAQEVARATMQDVRQAAGLMP
jgi:tryptophanyl-tRNA synthetase